MADHPLRPAIDRSLGGPLHRQLANLTRADLSPINLSQYGVSGITPSFPGLFRSEGHVPTRYSPVCHSPCGAFDLHVLSLPPAFVLSQNQTLRLRFDSDETKSVMEMVAAKHLRIFDGKPVHMDPTHAGPDINWLSIDKRKPSMSILGLTRPKPIENPASNIAARVSLPLTMSNILQTLGFHPGVCRIRSGQSGRPRLREGGV